MRLFANLLGLAEARLRQRADFLRSIELFASMSLVQLYEAARMMHERQLEAGAYLARENKTQNNSNPNNNGSFTFDGSATGDALADAISLFSSPSENRGGSLEKS